MCMTGMMMWLGWSSEIWTMYSPRSVSVTWMPFGFERFVHVDLFGRHALAFDAALEVVLLADVDDVAVGFGGVGRPQDVPPGGGDVGFHLFEQFGQIVERAQTGAASLLAQRMRHGAARP